MPSHNHQLQCHLDPVSDNSVRPDNNLLAESPLGDIQYSSGDPDEYMSASSLANAGGGQAHDNLPPYLVVNFVIALQGLFPSRN